MRFREHAEAVHLVSAVAEALFCLVPTFSSDVISHRLSVAHRSLLLSVYTSHYRQDAISPVLPYINCAFIEWSISDILSWTTSVKEAALSGQQAVGVFDRLCPKLIAARII